jgi:hypothetical protein
MAGVVVAAFVVMGLFSMLVSFGLSTSCTDNYSCSDTWCSPCRWTNWVPIIHIVLQVGLATAAAWVMFTPRNAPRRTLLRNSWLTVAATVVALFIAWATYWAN